MSSSFESVTISLTDGGLGKLRLHDSRSLIPRGICLIAEISTILTVAKPKSSESVSSLREVVKAQATGIADFQ